MGIGHCLASHKRVTCKVTALLGLSFIFQPFFQPLNIVICKVLNARGLNWFVPVVHTRTTAVIDWRQLRKKKSGWKWYSSEFQSLFKPNVLVSLFLQISTPLWPNMGIGAVFFLPCVYGKCGQFFQYFCKISQIYGRKQKKFTIVFLVKERQNISEFFFTDLHLLALSRSKFCSSLTPQTTPLV
jgi:hypothetical protein